MSIGLKSDSSGTSGSIVINGSDKVVVTSAGNVTAGTFTGALTGSLTAGGSVTSGVAVASTSGTAIDFTGIPSWAKRITVMFDGVSTTSGTSPVAVQLGKSGGVETTGYSGFGIFASASSTASNIIKSTANTIGFNLSFNSLSDDSNVGIATILNISGNTWVFSSNIIRQDYTPSFGNGAKTLAGTLDRVRVTTVNGTDTFDAGSINIMYEG
jgi:hypothetical protein